MSLLRLRGQPIRFVARSGAPSSALERGHAAREFPARSLATSARSSSQPIGSASGEERCRARAARARARLALAMSIFASTFSRRSAQSSSLVARSSGVRRAMACPSSWIGNCCVARVRVLLAISRQNCSDRARHRPSKRPRIVGEPSLADTNEAGRSQRCGLHDTQVSACAQRSLTKPASARAGRANETDRARQVPSVRAGVAAGTRARGSRRRARRANRALNGTPRERDLREAPGTDALGAMPEAYLQQDARAARGRRASRTSRSRERARDGGSARPSRRW